MTNSRIFLVDEENERLLPMREERYAQEDILQDLISAYPDLIPGDQIDDERPRRWLLVKQEMGVPGMEAGSDRWSLDHLFLDQDGIPTFVECKRSTDTRIRREVVAQMLDYAANGTEYWPVDRLRQAAAETAIAQNTTIDEVLAKVLEDAEPESLEAYWDQVATNLAEGRVRLLFVADETPRELRRLVEFLNAKMSDVEALIVEVKQFKGLGQTAVVPRVIGQTEVARARKRKGSFVQTEIHQLRLAFWTQLLERADEYTDLHTSVSPVVGSGLYAPAGRSDMWFAYRITVSGARVAFYLDSSDPELNRAHFSQLEANKEAIEADFGEPLLWDAKDGRLRCSIEQLIRLGGYREDEACWPEIQEAMIDAMIRLEKALKPHIETVD